ncbi:MAG: PrkA family serine protein kinase [Planctomycetota bacterium]|jgi:predicted Ser/Thr protein kinase
MKAEEFLDRAGAESRDAYERDQRLLTFDGFLERFAEDPYGLGRSAVQYAVDAVDHFGTRRVPGIGGPVSRWCIWDAPFEDGRGAVYGEEDVQERIVRTLRSAAEDGRLDRLVVLHGPNGSSKSSLVSGLMRGLAHYSAEQEGALYRFYWVFPRSTEEESLGFGATASRDDSRDNESFALLDPGDIAARIPCELRDNPLLVLPAEERRRFLGEISEERPPRRTLRHLMEGCLSPRSKVLFDGLLAGYQGDLRKVLRHVQVERWYIDPRYRRGAVVIPPQQHVDAGAREVSAGTGAAGLPAMLHHAQLVEASGDLVDANRGLLEFSDLLKRPLELWKYLLHTTEKGTVAIGPYLAHLNLMLFATTNEKYLDAFKQSPDWTSFKARMELVAVPYLLDRTSESLIYRDIVSAVAPGRHVAPHVMEGLAHFAVLTRLRRPDPEMHDEEMAETLASLTPEDKMRLYESGEPPDGLEPDKRRTLVALIPELRDEYRDAVDYEGRYGASAREIRTVIAAAASDPQGEECLHPAVVFRHLEELLRDRTVYEFLRIESQEGFHDSDRFAATALRRCRERALQDLQDALELVPPDEYLRRFERYVSHVIAFTRGEKVRNPVSGTAEAPDEEIMGSVERLVSVEESPAVFRQNLVARIGAWGVDHPGEKPDFRRLFPRILRALRDDYFRRVRERVREVEGRLLKFGTPEFDRLPEDQQTEVRRALGNLEEQYGYCSACSRDAVLAIRELLEEQ